MKCDSCHYRNRLDEQTLECRRFPPQSTVIMTLQQSVLHAQPQHVPVPFCGFPLVQPDQWCGEFIPAGQMPVGKRPILLEQ